MNRIASRWLGIAVAAGISMLSVSAAMAADLRTVVPQQVHDPGICWDPDVEFPVPCDDDDD